MTVDRALETSFFCVFNKWMFCLAGGGAFGFIFLKVAFMILGKFAFVLNYALAQMCLFVGFNIFVCCIFLKCITNLTLCNDSLTKR